MKLFSLRSAVLGLVLAAFSSTSFAEGNITYVLHKSENPTADELDAYQRITAVMDSAVYLYNKYSNLSKYINVYYAPGVPTAEASSNGDLRFGENRTYMVVPTAMHEMAHTLGIGTTREYWDACPESHVFADDKVQEKLRELSGKPDEELHCDSQHIWPFGLNRASEVSSENDLVIHVQLIDFIYQRLYKDAFYKQGRVMSLALGKCMGMTSSNALELMDCSDTATFAKLFSMGDNPVTYRVQFGNRVIDIPNESTAAGVRASTYGFNNGAHQKYLFEDALVDTPNAVLLKNYKSGHYLQAVGNTVVQNPKGNSDDFIWQIVEASAADTSVADTSVADTVVADTSKKDSSGTDGLDPRRILPSLSVPQRQHRFDALGRNLAPARKRPRHIRVY